MPKSAEILQKNEKLREPWYQKVSFLKLHFLFVYLYTKFEVSSVILTSFRQGVTVPPPPTPSHPRHPAPQNGPLKSPPRLEFIRLAT